MLKYFQEILLLKYTFYANTFKDILISNIHTHKYMQNTYTTYIISKNILISNIVSHVWKTHIIHSISIDIFISTIHIIYISPHVYQHGNKKKSSKKTMRNHNKTRRILSSTYYKFFFFFKKGPSFNKTKLQGFNKNLALIPPL